MIRRTCRECPKCGDIWKRVALHASPQRPDASMLFGSEPNLANFTAYVQSISWRGSSAIMNVQLNRIRSSPASKSRTSVVSSESSVADPPTESEDDDFSVSSTPTAVLARHGRRYMHKNPTGAGNFSRAVDIRALPPPKVTRCATPRRRAPAPFCDQRASADASPTGARGGGAVLRKYSNRGRAVRLPPIRRFQWRGSGSSTPTCCRQPLPSGRGVNLHRQGRSRRMRATVRTSIATSRTIPTAPMPIRRRRARRPTWSRAPSSPSGRDRAAVGVDPRIQKPFFLPPSDGRCLPEPLLLPAPPPPRLRRCCCRPRRCCSRRRWRRYCCRRRRPRRRARCRARSSSP